MSRKKIKKNKIISVEQRSIVALDYVGEYVEDEDEPDYDLPNRISSYDAEKLIYFLPTDEVEVLLLRFLGYNSIEIVDILQLKDKNEYYTINRDTKIQTDLFNILHKDSKMIV